MFIQRRDSYPVTSKVLVTGPAREPISLAEAKLHLRVDGSFDDILIASLITTAREWIEQATNRRFVQQTWDFFWGQFPGVPPYRDADEIIFPLSPVTAVTQFAFTQSDGTAVNWTPVGANLLNQFNALNAHVDANTTPQRVRLAYSCVWPSQVLQTANAVRIRCTVGYPSWRSTVTKAGQTITKTGGDPFDATWPENKRLQLNGFPVLLSSVTDGNALKIVAPAADLEDMADVTLTADGIPEKPRAAMKLLIGHLYENREAVTDGTLMVGAELPLGIAALLGGDEKVWHFA